ncbi:MAG: 3-hydroxyacyl-ACP dehydratase [Desulfuromonas sp.]|nr:MAG: 3-hydroxyacyl-ACP dehydratase [Desulfuromonas sp.]
MDLTLPLEAEELIPHRLPMRLVDRLVDIDDKNGTIEADIRADCPLVDASGVLDDIALTELIAQAYAMIKGYNDLLDAAPVRQGFLVGIKKLTRQASANSGDTLRIAIRTIAEFDDLAIARGEIWRADECLAEGEIKVWIN